MILILLTSCTVGFCGDNYLPLNVVGLDVTPREHTYLCEPLDLEFSPSERVGEFLVTVDVSPRGESVSLKIHEVASPTNLDLVPEGSRNVELRRTATTDPLAYRLVQPFELEPGEPQTLRFDAYLKRCVNEAFIVVRAQYTDAAKSIDNDAREEEETIVVRLRRIVDPPPPPPPASTGLLVRDQEIGACGGVHWVDSGILATALNDGKRVLINPEKGGTIIYDLETLTAINTTLNNQFSDDCDTGVGVIRDSLARPEVTSYGINGSLSSPYIADLEDFASSIASFQSILDGLPYSSTVSGILDSILLTRATSVTRFGADGGPLIGPDNLSFSGVTGKLVSTTHDPANGDFYFLVESQTDPYPSAVYRYNPANGGLENKLVAGNAARRLRICGDLMLISNEGSETLTVYVRNESGGWDQAQAGIAAGKIRTFTAVKKGDDIIVAWGNGNALRFVRLGSDGGVLADETRGIPTSLNGDEVFHLRFYDGCAGLAGVTETKMFRTGDMATTFELPAAFSPDS